MQTTVLHLVHKLGFGGTERVITNLVNNPGSKCRNLICSFYPFDNEFLKEINNKDNSLFCLNKREGTDFRAPFRIASLCKTENVDIIHSLGWSTYAEGITAAYCFGKRYPFIHSFRGKTQEDLNGIPYRRILAQKLFARFCDAIVCPSELTRDDYRQMLDLDPGKITVIYNGVEISRFQSVEQTLRECYRRELRITGNDCVIGFVGRFDSVKNLDGLIHAFSLLPPNHRNNSKLLLIGDGSEYEAIKKVVQASGLETNVILPGMKRDVPKFLSVMDIYVQPSKFEGVPNSVLEAMASGLPVIATDVGGLREIIHDGESGILLEPGQDEALSLAISKLITHPEKRRQLGNNAQNRVTELFSIDKMVSDYEIMYKRILQCH
ncbi:MAG: glycosyltransferase [Deltaproteobacteria bacterium]|nr:glycosyltransferase [Deltaproteobacteria bacterium]